MAEDLAKASGLDGLSIRDTAPAFAPSTQAVHADDALNSATDVAPPLHVATTFRYPDDPDELLAHTSSESKPHIYSRLTTPNTTRLELILSSLLHGPAITYSSGLSAFHALLVHLRPNVVAIGAGYHGCHGVLRIYQKLTGCRIVDLHDTTTWDDDDRVSADDDSNNNNKKKNSHNGTSNGAAALGHGDLVHVETPLNPDGTAVDISHYARLAHARGALLSVDATFAPPPLLDPFRWGADYVMHSGTKYFGGHSDMLCGVLAVNPSPPPPAAVDGRPDGNGMGPDEAIRELRTERVFLGSVMGGLEGWLGVRSIRTLELRVVRQSRTAEELVRRLTRQGRSSSSSSSSSSAAGRDPGASDETARLLTACVAEVRHASVQSMALDAEAEAEAEAEAADGHDGAERTGTASNNWIRRQMPNGFGPVFGLYMTTPDLARKLPSKLGLFHHATSLGGVESLIEWRRMSDPGVDERLLRVSIGVEDVEDLWADLVAAMKALV